MRMFLQYTNKTSVKVLLVTGFILPLHFALADVTSTATPATNQTPSANTCDDVNNMDKPACTVKRCNDLSLEALKASGDIRQACADSGYGDSCELKIRACDEVTEEQPQADDSVWTNAANSLLASYGIDTSDKSNKSSKGVKSCSTIETYQNYKDAKKEYTDTLKEKRDKLSDLQKELRTAKSDSEKEIADIQKDLKQVKKDIEADKSNIDKDTQDQLEKTQQSISSINSELRKRSLSLIDLRSSLVKSERDYNLNLLQADESTARAACEKKIQDQYNQFLAEAEAKSISFSARKAAVTQANNNFKICLKGMSQQTAALTDQWRADQKRIKTQIEQTQTEMAEMDQQITDSQNQLSTMQQQATANKNSKVAELTQEMQDALTKINAAKARFTQTQADLNMQISGLTNDINDTQSKINGMGPIPDESATKSTRSAIATIHSKIDVINNYTNTCCDSANNKAFPSKQTCDSYTEIVKINNKNIQNASSSSGGSRSSGGTSSSEGSSSSSGSTDAGGVRGGSSGGQ